MAIYAVAAGGNKRNWPGWDNLLQSGNSLDRSIGYEAALKTRHIPLPFNFDGSNHMWQSWLSQTTPTNALAVGDALHVNWINPGSDVKAIYVHVKRPATAATAVTIGVKLATGVAVGAPVAVDLTVPGFVKIPVDSLLQTKGVVEVALTGGDFMSACFEVFTDLFDAYGEHPCGCYIAPCEVPVPDPDCFQPSVTCG